jgi:hypothetical protein
VAHSNLARNVETETKTGVHTSSLSEPIEYRREIFLWYSLTMVLDGDFSHPFGPAQSKVN